jgi:hypothetical protein
MYTYIPQKKVAGNDNNLYNGYMAERNGLNLGSKPRNKVQGAFWDKMTEDGWELTKKAWPDFLCMKDGKVILVTVKGSRGRKIKAMQRAAMLFFAKHGIDCFNVNQNVFEKITYNKPS